MSLNRIFVKLPMQHIISPGLKQAFSEFREFDYREFPAIGVYRGHGMSHGSVYSIWAGFLWQEEGLM